MNRFAFVVCHSGRIEFIIPEINLRGSEPTENIDDVVSLLVNRYNVGEYQVVQSKEKRYNHKYHGGYWFFRCCMS